jgi:hypothetical protein
MSDRAATFPLQQPAKSGDQLESAEPECSFPASWGAGEGVALLGAFKYLVLPAGKD